jgi:CrcB protein
MRFDILLYVGLGGALGSMLRFSMGYLFAATRFFNVASGTLIVNLIGSFLIGLLFSGFVKSSGSELIRFFLLSGVLGGFTTFSAFSLENLHLLREGNIKFLLLNSITQVLGGLLFAFLGYYIGEKIVTH